MTGQGFHDPPGVTEVDLIGILLVFRLFAELFQLPPASRLVRREHPQPLGEGGMQELQEMAGLQDRRFPGEK